MRVRGRLWWVFLVCALALPSWAAYLRDVPVEVAQPDGTVVHCYASGDEFFNWLHDEDGFPIMRDPATGRLVYAATVNGEPVPTKYVVGTVDPHAVGLTPGRPQSATKVNARAVELRDAETRGGRAPSSGTFNNLVVFIRFSDEAEFTDAVTTYTGMHNNVTPGANSVRNYYTEVSYGALTVSSTFYPTPPGSTVVSYQDANPRNYYRPYNATTNPTGYATDTEARTREHTLLKNAVNAVAAQVPAGLNLDGDSDGKVDNICFIVKGNVDGWSDLLWPHQWALWTYTVNLNGKRVWDYNLQFQTHLQSRGVGVLCHELFHTMGAPDLYHYTNNGIDPVGEWDLMEYDQNPPQHVLMYMKKRYGGWVASIPEITSSGTYTLSPVTSPTNSCYKIASPNSATEYYVVEYRRKTGPFENSVPGSGLIIYRINTAADGEGNRNGPPDEVYIYRPNGTTTVNGSYATAHFSANTGRTAINDATNPSPFLANGSAGGLDISNVGTVGDTISFHVSMGADSIPDLWIRNAGEASYAGDNVYNMPAQQTKTQRRDAGSTAIFQLAAQNDASAPDSFAIRGPAGSGGWTVRYYNAAAGGTEITAAVTSPAGWGTPSLAAGQTQYFRVEVTPSASVPTGEVRQLELTATSQTDGAVDAAYAVVRFRGPIARVSETLAGVGGNYDSYQPAISADGNYAAFATYADNLGPLDTNSFTDVFVGHTPTGALEWVSLSTAGALGNWYSEDPAISADGRYVAFYSEATNLTAGDTNLYADIFVRDRVALTTTRVSVSSAGAQANGPSFSPAISADGRYVAFASAATNLVIGDTNGSMDIFVHDRQTGLTRRVSVSSAGAQGDAYSEGAAISADGRYVAFHSDASNLVTGDNNWVRDVFVHDLTMSQTTRVSVSSAGDEANENCSTPAISADGRYVAFESAATNLAVGNTNWMRNIFLRDRTAGVTERVSLATSGVPNDDCYMPALSADGRFVAYESYATNLVADDTNGVEDLFVRDRTLGATARVSTPVGATQANGDCYEAAINANGRYLVFTSTADNLISGDTNGYLDVFLRERTEIGPLTGVTLTANVASPQLTGTPVTLTALPQGGYGVLYKFLAYDGMSWATLQDYGAANVCVWTPAATGTYTLTVWAAEAGSEAPYDVLTTLPYTIGSPTISAVSLAASPAGSTLAGRQITLTATPTGGQNVEYRFFKVYNGVTTTIQPYTLGANTFQITPSELGQYQFIVWAREVGSATKVYTSVVHNVNPPLSGATLKATPAWPQPPGTVVTLKAGQVNGGQIEYRFYVAEPGGPLVIVQPYGTTDTCAFTVTQQGVYQFLVYAREVGATVTKQAHAAVTFNCATPITSVDMVADPPSPGTVNAPVNLTATAHGGLKVQYRFFVCPPGGVYTTLQHYAVDANTCQYTPTVAGRYYFMVYVRETYSTKPGKDAYRVLTYTVE